MPETESALSLSNSSAESLFVWFEPWAEEHVVPPRGVLTLEITAEPGFAAIPPQTEPTEDGLTLYAEGGTLIRIKINGADQHSIAHEIAAPDAGPLSTRGFVDMVFGSFPEARPGGAQAPVRRRGWLSRFFGR